MCATTDALYLRLCKKWRRKLGSGEVDYFDLWFDVLHFYVMRNEPDIKVSNLVTSFLGLQDGSLPPEPKQSDCKGMFAYDKLGFSLVSKNETSTVCDCFTLVILNTHPDLCSFTDLQEATRCYDFLCKYRKALRKQKSTPASESDPVQFSFQFEEDEK